MEFFKLGNPYAQPLKDYIDVSLSPKKTYNKTNTFVYSEFDNKYNFIGGIWDDTQLIFSTRDFGNYTILTDSLAPLITPISITKNSFKFKIDDKLSGIKNFNVYVNGNWILADYDYKTKLIWSIEGDINLKANDVLNVVVIDNAANEANYSTKIK